MTDELKALAARGGEMTDTMELARRAVACKGWQWQSGMQEVRRGRVMDVVTHEGETLARALVRDRSTAYMNGSVNLMWTAVTSSWLPDLTDACTLGGLLALVREAWQDTGLVAAGTWGNGTWIWQISGGKLHGSTFRSMSDGRFDTEAAALVAALEAAP